VPRALASTAATDGALHRRLSKERVRDAVDMVDLVGTRTELRRAGADSYSGLCPFHDERTPSFSVKPSEKVYYCFGCQARATRSRS
jgi:DNA primase